MAKRKVQEARFDFRGGRNTAISPDLLNNNELVDATNCRLVDSYGAFGKRTGCQRIHAAAFPAAIRGVTQWDGPSGKQTVVISNGSLYWRDGTSFTPAFTQATSTAVARTTANQGTSAGWTDPDGTNNGINTLERTTAGVSTSVAGDRLINKFGDPAIDNNLPAVDNLYKIGFKLNVSASGLDPGVSAIGKVEIEYSLNNGGVWNSLSGSYSVTAGRGQNITTEFTPTLLIVAGAAPIWIRLKLTLTLSGSGADLDGIANVQCFKTTYLTDNYATTWTTGAAMFSLTQPAIFAPFRASSSGAPLILYIASGGHYFSWDGAGVLTQLDPTNNAPLTTAIISYHTRMFAMSASAATPGLLPKTIFWSKIGDATDFTTGAKNQGGSAVTDFLTGQQLTALEVIGSSLLMATIDSVMRFTGQASDDIVIAQNTEGISAEVGAVGILALKRFENVAAMLAQRGPYAVTDTSATPIGEQVLPDFNALDSTNITNSIVLYHRGRKELLFVVPGASDGGLNKTVFVQAVRLQSWYGPWLYSFGITSACNYVNSSGIENWLSGGSDGFVRLMDIGAKDDVLSDGTSGSNITMIVELPTLHFGDPGITKTARQMLLQAKLPTGHALQVLTQFDGGSTDTGSFVDTTYDGTERHYRVDLDGQGKRCRLRFTDASAVQPSINGFTMQAYNMLRP